MSEAQQGNCLWASTTRRLRIAFALALILLVTGGIGNAATAAEDLSVFQPASQPAESIRDLFYLVLAITGAIFLLVEGMLIYAAVRYRRRAAVDVGKADPEPAQVYGSPPLEVAWTVAPLLIVFVLFLVVVRSVVEAQQANDDPPAVRLQVIGHQWWWELVYPHDQPEQSIRSANEIHVPVGEDGRPARIEIELLSADVIHSFWVPRLAGKTDLIPGRTNRMWFACGEPGTYFGQCAEFCGLQHANMKLRVVVESRAEFDRWLQNERQPAAEVPSAARGREKFLSLSCVNCHTIRGTVARGTVGPDLTHLMARRTLAAGVVENDHEHLRQWIADPDALKPGSEMPDLRLSPADVDTIVAFLESLQ